MAIKPDRHILYDDITFICYDVAERGTFLVHSGSGESGVVYDSILNVARMPGSGDVSGAKVAGMLLSADLVSVDETRYRLNQHRAEQRTGNVVGVLKKGWVYTNLVSGTPGAGDPAYLAASGHVAPSQVNSAPRVGTFKGRKDGNGFVRLEVDVDSYN